MMSKEDSEIDLKVSNTCRLCMSGHSEQFVASDMQKYDAAYRHILLNFNFGLIY